ncbi:MAG: HEAT repeat domain-containing protein [Planctomycetota bacterium]|jgi:hypothetical protein
MPKRTLPLLLLALTALPAHAERIGEPYRGPFELLVANDPNPQPGLRRGPQFGSHVLWQFWWELNKDRYLARATARRRANAGSALYWFGAVAKYPPRDLVPVSAAQRKATVLKALVTRLRSDPHAAVRAEAAIALGRLGEIRNGENAVTRELTRALDREAHPEVRASAILALGMSGDADGCRVLMERFDKLGAERPYVNLAFGLARYRPAADLLVFQVPRRARGRRATDATVAAEPARSRARDGRAAGGGQELEEQALGRPAGARPLFPRRRRRRRGRTDPPGTPRLRLRRQPGQVLLRPGTRGAGRGSRPQQRASAAPARVPPRRRPAEPQ